MIDIIPVEIAGTLDGLFSERVRRSPDTVAYRGFYSADKKWRDHSWAQMDQAVAHWQDAFTREGLTPGDRVAVMLRNCPEWVMFDQAALGLGLVVVPLYTADHAENAAYILRDAGARLLLLEDDAQWQTFSGVRDQLGDLLRVVVIAPFVDGADAGFVVALDNWLPAPTTNAVDAGQAQVQVQAVRHVNSDPHALATIMYTSGTSGRPKGVMLSHHNLLSNAHSCLQVVPVYRDDLLLSFLPLSHTFERTVGYYLPMMCGTTVAHARSIQLLREDFLVIRPTVLISVPRIYERTLAAIRVKLADGPIINRLLFNLAVAVGYSRFETQQGRGHWYGRIFHLLWPLLNKLVAGKVLSRLGGRLQKFRGYSLAWDCPFCKAMA